MRRQRPVASAGVLVLELCAAVVALGAAALAGIVFVHRPDENRFDTLGFALVPAHPESRGLGEIARLGSLPVLVVGIAVLVALSVFRRPLRALACAVGPIAAAVITEAVAKPLVGRHLTGFGGSSYPSGTVTSVAALATALVLVTPRRLRILAGALAVGAVAVVSVTVVALRWHFPTDTVGGALVGFGAVLFFDASFQLPARVRLELAAARRPAKATRAAHLSNA